MYRSVSDDAERLGIAGLLKHGGGVSTNQQGLSRIKAMMIVKVKKMRIALYAAVIVSHLSVVLANVIQVVEFKRPDGTYRKFNKSGFFLNVFIVHGNSANAHGAEIRPAGLLHYPAEILNIHRSAQAFAANTPLRVEIDFTAEFRKNVTFSGKPGYSS